MVPPTIPSSATPPTSSLSPEDNEKAQKYCRFAASALQYEDVQTAVENLHKALALLQKWLSSVGNMSDGEILAFCVMNLGTREQNFVAMFCVESDWFEISGGSKEKLIRTIYKRNILFWDWRNTLASVIIFNLRILEMTAASLNNLYNDHHYVSRSTPRVILLKIIQRKSRYEGCALWREKD